MATTLRDEVPGATPDFLEANWPAETDLVLCYVRVERSARLERVGYDQVS